MFSSLCIKSTVFASGIGQRGANHRLTTEASLPKIPVLLVLSGTVCLGTKWWTDDIHIPAAVFGHTLYSVVQAYVCSYCVNFILPS